MSLTWKCYTCKKIVNGTCRECTSSIFIQRGMRNSTFVHVDLYWVLRWIYTGVNCELEEYLETCYLQYGESHDKMLMEPDNIVQ